MKSKADYKILCSIPRQ
ncbi:unnamed protein product [Debaryomyces tyrocola]|nr:unnamed protein product [Debaryomyces tyrocola]